MGESASFVIGGIIGLTRGHSDFDIRHAFKAGLTYDLPGAGSHRVVRTVLGGWSLDGFVLARSAPPAAGIGAISQPAGSAFHPRLNVNPGANNQLPPYAADCTRA